MPIYVNVISQLDERAAAATARAIDRQFGDAGVSAGKSLGSSLTDAIDRATRTTGAGITTRFSDHGALAGRNFGSSFNTSVGQAIPSSGGAFSSALGGYSAAATRAGSTAGRALGTAFTVAAGGLIGAASLTLFKGFERYQSIDAAKNRLENLNRTLTATGRAGLDVGAVMNTVTKAVTDTPFALDQAFSVATRALASNTGDLQRFMTVVTDAAGFAGAGVDEIGEAFLKVANTGKLSMEEIGNELRNIPILPWLQQQLGVTGGELQKMISDGKVGLADLMKAVEANASGFAKASGDTIAGAMQNMQTAVARVGANLLGAVFGKPTEDANTFKDAIKEVSARLNDVNAWVTAHQGDIREVFETATDVGGDLLRVLGDITTWFANNEAAVYALGGVIGASFAASKLTGFIDALTTISTKLGAKGGPGILGQLGALGIAAGQLAQYNSAPGTPEHNLGALSTLAGGAAAGASVGGLPGAAIGTLVGAGAAMTPALIDAWKQPPPLQPGAAGVPFDPTALVTGTPAPGQAGGNPLGALSPGGPGGPAPAPAPGQAPAGNPILAPPGAGDSGSGPKLPKAPVVPYDTSLPPGIPGMPPDASVFAAESSFLDARHDLAEKQARLNQLINSNVATEQDILDARNDVAAEERDFQAAEMRMNDARQTQYKQMTKQLDSAASDLSDLGAALDKDFGISKGLGGIVENFVKAAGNILAAPFLQALGLIEKANPNEGSGLIGILAANGAFGSQYTPGYLAAQQGSTSAYGPAYGLPQGLVPTRLSDTGRVPSGPQSRTAAALIERIFGSELRGTIGGSRDNNTAKNTHDAGLSIDIPIGPDQMALGDRINAWLQQNAGALGLEYSIWRDKGQYPGGGSFNQPGHQNHIDAHFNGNVSAAADSLTNLAGAATQATGALTAQSSLWDKVAQAESNGNWGNQDTGRNGHFGGLQFSPETWRAYGGIDLTGQSNPANASREQQIEIANRTAFTGYNGTPPQGLGAWETITNGSVPGVSVNTPPSAFSVGSPASLGIPALPGGPVANGMPQAGPFTGGQPAVSPASFGNPFSGQVGAGAGIAYPSQGGNSGNIAGGLPLDAVMGAASGLDMVMPGAGAAAKIGVQLANRTIGYVAQDAGILASGALETLSVGDNPMGSLGAGWIGKLIGGLAGAAPALPNLAGGQKAPLPPGQGGANNSMVNSGNTNINVTAPPGADGNKIGSAVAEHQNAIWAQPGKSGG